MGWWILVGAASGISSLVAWGLCRAAARKVSDSDWEMWD